MFHQILRDENPQLDFYALAYAKYSVCYYESFRGCWTTKYTYNVERPDPLYPGGIEPSYVEPTFQYARDIQIILQVILPMQAFSRRYLQSLFGPNYSFTLHTYDNLGHGTSSL